MAELQNWRTFVGDKYAVIQVRGQATATRWEMSQDTLGHIHLECPVQFTSLYDAIAVASIDGDKAFQEHLERSLD